MFKGTQTKRKKSRLLASSDLSAKRSFTSSRHNKSNKTGHSDDDVHNKKVSDCDQNERERERDWRHFCGRRPPKSGLPEAFREFFDLLSSLFLHTDKMVSCLHPTSTTKSVNFAKMGGRLGHLMVEMMIRGEDL